MKEVLPTAIVGTATMVLLITFAAIRGVSLTHLVSSTALAIFVFLALWVWTYAYKPRAKPSARTRSNLKPIAPKTPTTEEMQEAEMAGKEADALFESIRAHLNNSRVPRKE